MNALQPVYQVMDQGILQDFINSLLVETIIPEQFIFDFATAQTALNQHGKNLQEVFKTRLNNFLCAITRRESARLGHVYGTKGITQAWKFANETEVFYWNAQMIMFRSM